MEYLIGLALGWMTLAFGLLFYRWVRSKWRTWRYGTPIEHNTLLMEYGRRMTGSLDQQELAQLLTVELPLKLQVEREVPPQASNHRQ